MTGFGRVEKQGENKTIIVEIKSLNSSRGAEILCKIPHLYKAKEMEIRSLVSKSLERGKIEVYISEKSMKNASTSFNEAQIGSYLSTLEKIKKEHGLADQNLLSIALKLPNSLVTEEQKVNEDDWVEVLSALKQGLERIKESRLQEGAKMEIHLREQIEIIASQAEKVAKADAPRIDNIKTRIKEKLAEALDEGKIDASRLEQELVYYAEKIDIAEEKIRLKAHLEYFIETIETAEVKGKKLNFICQELGREINTTGSKANDLTIQKQVVVMKEALDKIKEQLANVL